MYCTNCGTFIPNGQTLCPNCQTLSEERTTGVGYSERISDPFFERHVNNSKRYARLFSVGLAFSVFIGFAFYGLTTQEMALTQALMIGTAIALMFLSIGQYAVMSRNGGRSWDGVVTDKRKKRVRKSANADSGNLPRSTIRYSVVIEEQSGREHEITSDDDPTLFDYYRVGDRVRHHGKLGTYEKYNKSGDEIIFCNACASLNQIDEERCIRCNAPLLK